MKKFLLRALGIATVVFTASATAYAGDFECGHFKYTTTGETTAKITDVVERTSNWENMPETLQIPATATDPADSKEYTVTEIQYWALNGMKNVKHVICPETLTKIDGDAFRESEIESIELNEGLTNIIINTFYRCKNLVSVVLPSTIEEIGENAFLESGIQNITFNEGLRTIGTNSFLDSQLQSVNLPSTVTTIGGGAFGRCPLTSVTLNEGLQSIGQSAFIEDHAFTELVIPSTVNFIEYAAFYNCTGIQTLTLKSATPPAISGKPFENVTATLMVPTGSKDAYTTFIAAQEMNNPIDELVDCGVFNHEYFSCNITSASTVKLTIPNRELIPEAVVIPDVVSHNNHNYDVVCLGGWAFSGNQTVKSIVCPSTLLEITENAFELSSVETVTLNEGLKIIGGGAFYSVKNLKTIVLPSTVETISDWGFRESGIETITLNDGLKTIGNDAFHGCTSLTAIDFPATLTSIGNNAFEGCTSLKTVVIPDNHTNIAYRAFYGCSALENVTIGNAVENIEEDAFHECLAVSNITVKSTTPPTVSLNPFHSDLHTSATLTVPADSKDEYQNHGYWGNFATINTFTQTGIENTLVETESTAVYNLQGMRIADSIEQVRQAGLYICNGKKIIINK